MIRQANKYDIQDIIRLLKEYAEQSSIAIEYDPMKWSKTHIEGVLAGILAGKGIILIDDQKSSVLIAVRNPVFWIEGAYQLVECFMYSKSKITLMKLIKEFTRIAQDMKQKGVISKAIIGSHQNANFEKLGFKQYEILWEL